MLHTIFIKCKVDVKYFIFIFILPSVPRFSVKKSVNQLIKNKRPKNYKLILVFSNLSFDTLHTEILILPNEYQILK